MISLSELLISYIKKHSHTAPRQAYAILSGYVGILCNLLLFAVKLTVGALTGAVSVTADAINNLSDATVNIVTIAGTKLASKPVDKEHPFGHGRVEYISALIVAFSIFLMSFELAKSAFIKILHPETVKYSGVYFILLLAAIGVKLWMAYFNRKLYRLTDNLNLKAVMQDSLNDCAATLSTIIALFVAGRFCIWWIDGAIGCGVAVFVFFSGVSIVKDILGPLLGQPPSKELTDRIEAIILDNELILGVHDLIVHNYGPGRIIASAHAEVPCNVDLVTAHEVIDRAEQQIMDTLNINICIHLDPVATNDNEQDKYKTLTEIIISDYNESFAFHDFRLTHQDGKTILSFDLVTPFEYENKKEQIEQEITQLYRTKLPEVTLKMNVEHSYTT